MKRETKRIFILGLFALLILSIFASMFVAAADFQGTIRGIPDTISSTFSNWAAGGLGPTTMKVLFFLLITALIYSVMTVSGFFQGGGLSGSGGLINWVIALIVSFIATAYITPDEFIAIAQGYGALGLTISIIIPFFILLFFTMAAAKTGNPMSRVVQWLMWGIFAFFVTYKYVYGNVDDKNGVLLIMMIASWGALIFNSIIFGVFMKMYLESVSTGAYSTVAKAVAMENLQASALEGLTKGVKV